MKKDQIFLGITIIIISLIQAPLLAFIQIYPMEQYKSLIYTGIAIVMSLCVVNLIIYWMGLMSSYELVIEEEELSLE